MDAQEAVLGQFWPTVSERVGLTGQRLVHVMNAFWKLALIKISPQLAAYTW